jgi:hypothetical protein
VLIASLSSCASLSGGLSGRAEAAEAPAGAADAAEAFAPTAELEAAELGDGARSGRGAGQSPVAVPEQPPTEERRRVYSAELELRVTGVEETRGRIISDAEEAGGYVESSSGAYVVIRVPAQTFETVLGQIEGYGTVRSRAVRTADVTEQYADLERRIALAERTRERFYTLLERSTDTEERVAILREIRRLTERIELLQSQLESLDRQIAYSRITVMLAARIDETAPARGLVPFPWIAALDPLKRTTATPASRPAVDLPADYAVFDTGRFVRAETAAGTRVRIGAVANEPRGDTSFWQQALAHHLADFYRIDRRVEPGAFAGVLLEAKGAQPFSYLVLAAVRGDEIIVAEAFFPDAEARSRRLDEIVDVLSEVEP